MVPISLLLLLLATSRGRGQKGFLAQNFTGELNVRAKRRIILFALFDSGFGGCVFLVHTTMIAAASLLRKVV